MAQFGQLVVQLELEQAAFAKGMADAAKRLEQVSNQAKKSQQGLNGLAQGFAGMQRAAAQAAAAFAAFRGVEAIIKAADQIKTLQASFTALTGDAARGADMLQRVVDVAMRTGAPLEAVGSAMQRLTIAMKALGASNAQVADFAETFLKLGKIGGSSAEEMTRALVQMAQGMAAGALQGEELKSILEGMPLVAQAIAKEFGVTIGQLKKMGSEGALTGDRVGKAILKMTKEVDKAFADMPVTLEQSLNRVQTQWTLFLASLDRASNLGGNVGLVLEEITKTIKRWTDELNKADGAMSGIQLAAKGLDIAFRGLAGVIALMNFQLELTIRSAATLVLLAGDVASGFSNVATIMADYGRSIALATGQLVEFEKRLLGIGKAQQAAARGASNTALNSTGAAGAGDADKLKKETEALQKRADAIAASINPQFAYNQTLKELNELLEKGFLSETNYALAKQKAIELLNAEAEAVRLMIDPSRQYQQELAKVNALYMAGKIEIEELIKAQEILKKKADEAMGGEKIKSFTEQVKELADTLGDALGDAFADVITGAATAEEAFKKFAATVIEEIAKIVAKAAAAWVVKTLFSSAAGGAGGGGAATQSVATGRSVNASIARMAQNAAAASFTGRAATNLAATGVPGSTTNGIALQRPELKVTVNNNAGDVVTTRQGDDGGLEITIDRVRQALSRDMRRGGNIFADTLERSYAMQRRGV